MTHHVKLYPPLDLVSEKYRSAGKDNSNLVFIPAITVAFAALEFLMWKIGASVGTLVMLVIEGIIIGALHDLMHTWFHLSGTRLLKYEWFQRLKRYHFYHHHHMQQNFGIIWFGWDRVFGTFRNRGRLVGQTGVEPA
jgi:sterol desaturase/sphingolipid hydroxylase (fatty acid hydroxylase superfamily)